MALDRDQRLLGQMKGIWDHIFIQVLWISAGQLTMLLILAYGLYGYYGMLPMTNGGWFPGGFSQSVFSWRWLVGSSYGDWGITSQKHHGLSWPDWNLRPTSIRSDRLIPGPHCSQGMSGYHVDCFPLWLGHLPDADHCPQRAKCHAGLIKATLHQRWSSITSLTHTWHFSLHSVLDILNWTYCYFDISRWSVICFCA